MREKYSRKIKINTEDSHHRDEDNAEKRCLYDDEPQHKVCANQWLIYINSYYYNNTCNQNLRNRRFNTVDQISTIFLPKNVAPISAHPPQFF